MKKQLVGVVLIILFFCIGLSGCTDTDKNKFVGTWIGTSSASSSDIYTFIFFSDGKGSLNSISSAWEIKDGKLVMVVTSAEAMTYTYSFAFTNNDRTLMLTNPNETLTLIKQ